MKTSMEGMTSGWKMFEERKKRQQRKMKVSGGERDVDEGSEAWVQIFWATESNAGSRLNCRKVEVRK